jgi:NADH:ubiquinone oxidoreductase subunit D
MRFYKSETYASYWFLSLHSFLGKRGDSYDRFLIRVREMYESVNIVFQILSNLSNNTSYADPQKKN